MSRSLRSLVQAGAKLASACWRQGSLLAEATAQTPLVVSSFAAPSSLFRGFAAGSSDPSKPLNRDKMERLDAEGPPIIEEDFKFVAEMYEKASGDSKIEYEAIAEGFNPYEEEWLYRADQGDSPANPIVVPIYGEDDSRIIGVADPDDDCVVWWCELVKDEPPRQVVENGEWYVLKHYEYRDAAHAKH